MNVTKPRLVEAGPGAGKTHSMVDEIVRAIQDLPPHRFLAAITYTRAAGAMIRERLYKKIQPKPNIFVGTTHSFVHRFVLSPCAELLSIFPANPVYAPIDVSEKGMGASRYEINLIKKGIIPYNSMITKTRDILKIPGIRDHICGRIASIFVDEFQDTDVGMLEIFEHFRKSKKTNLYFVGDPEQYVMSFSYRGKSPPAFDKIPFIRLKKHALLTPILENHRSNAEIVKFTNQFREDVKQVPVKPSRKEARVIYISATSLEEIIPRFQLLSTNIEIEGTQRIRLYLSEENATFDSICDQFQLEQISNDGKKTNTILGDALELLSVALDRNQRKILEEFGFSRLQWRVFGIRLLMKIRENHIDIDQFKAFVTYEFEHKISNSRIKLIEEGLSNLRTVSIGRAPSRSSELYTSIRKAKGLQADAALVIAKSPTELRKWLQTDRLLRIEDKQDKCRLGYVAFTRPKEMLCIACLKEIDSELVQIIQNHRIVVDGEK